MRFGPYVSRASSLSLSYLSGFDLTHTQLALSCPSLTPRTLVSPSSSASANLICTSCARWISLMRSMIVGYDKGRGLRGNAAFKEFLEGRGNHNIPAS